MSDISNFNTLFLDWFLLHGIKIIGIVIVSFFLQSLGGSFIEKAIRRAIKPSEHLSQKDEKKREDTLIRIFVATFNVLLLILALLMILSEIGLDIGPLLAGAGIVGVAVGFGGQYLIKDLISGFFIIFENQYRVGDVVCINKTCGAVEDISLRITTLRDLDGTVHFVPNGEIRVASNLAKDRANINLNIGVAYSTNIDHAIKVINKVGKTLSNDSEWKEKILIAPSFLRVNSFDDSAITIKITGEVLPLEQWSVTGELRKRLKEEFDKEKIEIPFPQRVIHQAK